MKKNKLNFLLTLFVLSLVLAFNLNLYSQNSRNDLYASYGVASVQEIASLLDDIVILPFIGGDFTIESSIGPVIAGYRRDIGRHFSLGITGSYTSFDKKYDVLGVKFNVSNTFTTVMLQSNYSYNPGSVVQLYSGISTGVTSFTQKDSASSSSETFIAFHINALGLKAGKNAGAFVELGFGYSGILNGGIFIKF